jgi:tetratricopeptide (TPR) repeat protein
MPRTSIRAGLATVLLVAIAGAIVPAAAQDWKGRGRVQGIVNDENGKPVTGATVKLTKIGADAGPEPLATNDKGRWSFLGLGGGMWKVEIEFPGYAISDGTIPVSEFGNNETLIIHLQPAAAVAAAQGGTAAAEEQAATEAATQALSEAGRLIEAGSLAEGRALLKEAMAILDVAKHPAILLTEARTWFQEGNIPQTLTTLEQALALDPNHVDSLKLISSILINEGREADAQQYVARLPAGQQVDPNALLNQGISLYNEGNLDEALSRFDQIVADYPSLADAYYYRGLVYLGKSQNAQAISDFKKMLELDPNHANAEEAKEFLQYLESQG